MRYFWMNLQSQSYRTGRTLPPTYTILTSHHIAVLLSGHLDMERNHCLVQTVNTRSVSFYKRYLFQDSVYSTLILYVWCLILWCCTTLHCSFLNTMYFSTIL